MAILNDLIVTGDAKFLGNFSAPNLIASKLSTDTAGSETNPVYFYNGIPMPSPYTIEKSVPSDALFTDTITTVSTTGSGNAVTAITANNGALTVTKGSTFLTAHPTITKSTDSTSTATPAHGGTFTVVDSVTRDDNGHVTKVNTKTVTLPTDNDTITTATTTGSGNAVTAITASNGALTITKGSTFLTAHPTISKSTDSTSTASPNHGDTFTVIDSITRDDNGHVTKVNTKTVTLPADNNTDTKVTQTVTTANAAFPLLLAPNGQTGTTTTSSYFDSGVTLNPSTNTITANISGNSATTTKLATARTISLTGSVTGSGSFDGSGNLSIATTTNHTHDYLPLSGGTLTGGLAIARADGGRVILNAPSSNTSLAGSAIDSVGGVLRIYGAKSADGTTVTSVGYPLAIDPYNCTVGGTNKWWSFSGTHTSYVNGTTSSYMTSAKHSSINGDVYVDYYRSKNDNITNEHIHRVFTQKYDGDTINSYADLVTQVTNKAVTWNFKATNLSTANLVVNGNPVYHAGNKPYATGVSTYDNSKGNSVTVGFTPSAVVVFYYNSILVCINHASSPSWIKIVTNGFAVSKSLSNTTITMSTGANPILKDGAYFGWVAFR